MVGNLLYVVLLVLPYKLHKTNSKSYFLFILFKGTIYYGNGLCSIGQYNGIVN